MSLVCFNRRIIAWDPLTFARDIDADVVLPEPDQVELVIKI